jgi:hypothetical protein
VVAQPIKIATNHKMQGQSAWANDRADRAATDQPITFAGPVGDGPVCIWMCGAGMRYTILLVCADKMLLDTRSLVLETAGYRTLRASTLLSGLGLAFCCNLVVIDTTFSDDQQEEFVARLHEKNPRISLLRLDTRVTALESLVETVKKALALGSPTEMHHLS